MELTFSAEFKTELIFVEKIEDVFLTAPEESFFIVDSFFKSSDWLKKVKNTFFIEGEEGKDFQQFERAVKWMTDNKADRNSTVFAIGGGAVSDFAGFLASVFNRGARLVIVPTTLLAAIDSSIGGKTALNYRAKNVVGTFYPADKVIISTEFFSSLNEEQIASGKAEIIKVALLRGGKLAGMVEKGLDSCLLTESIKEAISDKYFFAGKDLDDSRGTRIYLNWGHTFGHAIERCYGIPHGIAVAAGMEMIQKYAALLIKDVFDPQKVMQLLKINNVYVRSDFYLKRSGEWLEYIKFDKKRKNEVINMVYLSKIGCPDTFKRSYEEITKDLEDFK